MSFEPMQQMIATYYALLRTAHLADTHMHTWTQLWGEAATMEDPVGTTFGTVTGREQIASPCATVSPASSPAWRFMNRW